MGPTEAFYLRLAARAATIDELLSTDGTPPPAEPDTATTRKRLAAWCRSSSNDDAAQFRRRLARDGLSLEEVAARLSGPGSTTTPPPPDWIEDAIWIEDAWRRPAPPLPASQDDGPPRPFQPLLLPLVEAAEARLRNLVGERAYGHFSEAARACLRLMLLDQLSDLCAPPLYERFAALRNATLSKDEPPKAGTLLYQRFVAEMKSEGFRPFFEDKPVLLRLIATLVRQWLDSVSEFVCHLNDDIDLIRSALAGRENHARVVEVEGALSDRHNGGRSVLIVTFEDGVRAVYKPKDLRLDVAWHDLVTMLNGSNPPVTLRAMRAIARRHYGWTEFIDHTSCTADEGFDLFFRRTGAWLALLHGFAATDMHQENVIASGDQPVPIDLETILQPAPAAPKAEHMEAVASDAAADLIANSVMAVGILPAYGRAPDTSVFAMGAMTANWNSRTTVAWIDCNTDAMRPVRRQMTDAANPNLPHIDGRYASFSDHVEAFVSGFEDYARFLSSLTRDSDQDNLFLGFAGAPVRRVIRPTRFYAMLLQRLKGHRQMDDGPAWAAQADFIARLSDWNAESDPTWPLHRAERFALLTLNIPHFVLPSDGHDVADHCGTVTTLAGTSGLERARTRIRELDETEIAWQTAVIRANAPQAAPPNSADAVRLILRTETPDLGGTDLSVTDIFTSEANRIAAELSHHAIRRGPSAAWIGLDWMGDAESFQLAPLGPDLYNGTAGIAVFLSAHAAIMGHAESAELARAALIHTRAKLKDGNAARFARSLGIGGATGLGSLVYALAVTGRNLHDDEMLADAHAAASLMTDALIATDRTLDALGGSAGAILALLRLHRDTQSDDVLVRAITCGEHLLRQERVGSVGRRSWIGQGLGPKPLNGMSHGAAGFAYALAALARVSGREDFQQAAQECLAFEDATYDAGRHNWPDLRHEGEAGWACRWCHGAPGIGLARTALLKQGAPNPRILRDDISNAVAGVERAWPNELDTLCCGTLGNVEFLAEAADILDRSDLAEIASRHLAAVVHAAASTGDYRWNSGRRQFNLGLFRGLAGVGYTLLRRRNRALPNVLIWE